MAHSASRLALIVLVMLFIGSAATQAQVSMTGYPPFSTFDRNLVDNINMANLNIHFEIPVRGSNARGLGFQLSFINDNVFTAPGSYYYWVKQRNWYLPTFTGGYMSAIGNPANCPGNIPPIQTNVVSNFVFTDAHLTDHAFPGAQVDTQGCFYGPSTQMATDGSGLILTLVPQPSTFSYTATVVDSYGIQRYPNLADQNGNQVVGFTDASGNTILNNSNGNPMTYSGPGGAIENISSTLSSFTFQTNFGCVQYHDGQPSATALYTAIGFPDGTNYQFTYEPTPGVTQPDPNNPTIVTKRIKSIKLRSGGTITYSYNGPHNGIACEDGGPSGFTKTTPDGTWTYSRSFNASTKLWTTTVIDPAGNQTVYTFSGPYDAAFQGSDAQFETQRLIYQKINGVQTLVQTLVTCYNGNFANCATAQPIWGVSQKDVYTFLPGLSQPSLAETLYGGASLVTQENYYDFGVNVGSAPTTNPIRAVKHAYTQFGGSFGYYRPNCVQVTAGPSPSTCGTVTSGTKAITLYSNYDTHGNVGTIQNWVSGSTYLSKNFTYDSHGQVSTVTDANGAQTSTIYNACNNSFPTQINEPLSLVKTMAWDCTGEVPLTSVDENNQTTTFGYTNQSGVGDPFWRPLSATDPLGNITRTTYSAGGVTPVTSETAMVFNSGASTSDVLTTFDSLGRPYLSQNRQAPGSANFDTTVTAYDSLGRVASVGLPCVSTASSPCTSAVTTNTYDTLSRPLQVTDGGGGYVTYNYAPAGSYNNDVLITQGPAPAGENLKKRQFQYDGLGRLTSVCEITSSTGSGTCAQSSSQTGFWTRYTYDALDRLTNVSQNAQGTAQSRSLSYDGLGRMISETNPENGTMQYFYDSAPSTPGYACGTISTGDLVKSYDARGNTICSAYDSLHRLIQQFDAGPNSQGISRYFVFDSATVNGVTMTKAKGRVAEAYTATCVSCTKITDLGFIYSARGEVLETYESTPHSSGYYHPTAAYWANGGLQNLWISQLPSIAYGADGEGRISTVIPTSGQSLVPTAPAYNPASQLTSVILGSSDRDDFTYDPNAGRVTQYKFSMGTTPLLLKGDLTWNSNGTLKTQQITDQIVSANSQICNYAYDDLVRIASANCGAAWSQTFGLDPFGNLSKSGSVSFQPTYSTSTNRIQSIPGAPAPTYDASGNLLTITDAVSHNYVWDGYGKQVTIDTVSLTYDALGRVVEQNRSGVYTQIVYSPTGSKFTLMNGTTLSRAFVPLPGGGTAVYNPSGLQYYRHGDWLGSSRLATTPGRTKYFDGVYAPYGEDYLKLGTTDLSFTGQNQDTVAGLYDFMYREYNPVQGRWISPDPAGVGAADPGNPQSWNRYAYLLNNPLSATDPLGLWCVWEDGTHDDDPTEGGAGQKECTDQGGTWDDTNTIAGMDENGNMWTVPTTVDVTTTPCNSGGAEQATTSERVTAGAMGTANLALAGYKYIESAGEIYVGSLAAAPTLGASLTVAAKGTYGIVSASGQATSGMGQIYTAASGNKKLGEQITQAGDIVSGPIAGFSALAITQDPAKAQKWANRESFFTAGAGLINSETTKGMLINAVDYTLSALGVASDGCN